MCTPTGSARLHHPGTPYHLAENIDDSADVEAIFFTGTQARLEGEETPTVAIGAVPQTELTIWLGYAIVVSNVLPLLFMVWPR